MAGHLFGVPLTALSSSSAYLRTLAAPHPDGSASVPFEVTSGAKTLNELENQHKAPSTAPKPRSHPPVTPPSAALPPAPVPFRATTTPQAAATPGAGSKRPRTGDSMPEPESAASDGGGGGGGLRPKKAARACPSLSWEADSSLGGKGGKGGGQEAGGGKDKGGATGGFAVGVKVEVLLDSGEWSEAVVSGGPSQRYVQPQALNPKPRTQRRACGLSTPRACLLVIDGSYETVCADSQHLVPGGDSRSSLHLATACGSSSPTHTCASSRREAIRPSSRSTVMRGD